MRFSETNKMGIIHQATALLIAATWIIGAISIWKYSIRGPVATTTAICIMSLVATVFLGLTIYDMMMENQNDVRGV